MYDVWENPRCFEMVSAHFCGYRQITRRNPRAAAETEKPNGLSALSRLVGDFRNLSVHTEPWTTVQDSPALWLRARKMCLSLRRGSTLWYTYTRGNWKTDAFQQKRQIRLF